MPESSLTNEITKKCKEAKKSELKFGIDRKQENRDVLDYVSTGDEALFETIYRRRLPTIEYLARQYHWLSDDAASEIKIVFVKTIRDYGKNGKKTDFNTYFYSSVKNHFVNAIKRKYRKKRTTIDGIDPLNRTVPLDDVVSDEDSNQYHELIASDSEKYEQETNFCNFVQFISEGNKILADILTSFKGLNRNQIIREGLTLSYDFSIITGNAYEDVYSQLGVPKHLIDIISFTINDGKIVVKLKVNTRGVMSYLCDKLKNSKTFRTEVEGSLSRLVV